MINDALNLIVRELNQYISPGENDSTVVLGNIGFIEGSGSNTADLSNDTDLAKMVLSLVNVEEEKTLKNGPHDFMRNGQIHYKNRPVVLNLYLLFSANFPVYDTSLKRLSQVIAFFQGKNIFTVQNSPSLTAESESLKELKLILELNSLSFEQINHLWGSLGGKQVPFVLYKARLIEIESQVLQGIGPPITQISVESNV